MKDDGAGLAFRKKGMRELGTRLRGWVRAEMGAGRGMNGWGYGVGLAGMALGLGRGLEMSGGAPGLGVQTPCFPNVHTG